jgi:hypothetical protein
MNVYCTVDYIKNEYTFLQGQVLKVKSVSYECMQSLLTTNENRIYISPRSSFKSLSLFNEYMQSSNEVLLYRGPSIDAFYQVLVHFGHAVLEEKIFF